LEWLHVPHMEIIGSLEFNVEAPSIGKTLVVESLNATLKQALNKLIAKVPFQGNVTGKEGHWVTINLGSLSGIKKGDILVIGTLDEVKQHPLLKKIVEWKSSPTGKIVVEQAEEAISFCKILEEDTGRDISRFQKIIQVQKAASPQQADVVSEFSEQPAIPLASEATRMGSLSLSLFPALYDRQYSDSSGISNTGGGIAYGAAASSEIRLTREWFAGLDIKFSFLNFTQKDISSGQQSPASLNGGVSQTALSYKLNVGYMYFLNREIFGPKGWLRGGYKSDAYNMPSTLGEFIGPITFGSFFVGAGAALPLRGNWGATADLSFRFITAVNQSYVADTLNGTSDVQFYLGGYYRINANSTFKLGIDVTSNSATYTAGASINQKMVSIAPALLYYF